MLPIDLKELLIGRYELPFYKSIKYYEKK